MGFVSNLFGAGEAQKAAGASAQGFSNAQEEYELARGRFEPYSNLGTLAVDNLYKATNGDMNAFRADPGYQFAFNEGQRALDNSGAARGMTFSGNQMKALTRYGQGMADQQYGNWFNRNLSLAGQGQNAANSMLSATQGVANMMTGQADARASGYLAKAGIKNGIANAVLDAGLSWVKGP